MNDDSAKPPMTTYYAYDSKGELIAVRDNPLLDVGGHPSDTGAELTAVYEYQYERPAPAFPFEHDAAQGVFRLTSAEGRVEVFRDKPVRYLCVEPDETGAMRPVTKLGRPVYLYLCREEREVR